MTTKKSKNESILSLHVLHILKRLVLLISKSFFEYMQVLCTFDIKIIAFLISICRPCALLTSNSFFVYAGFMHLRYQKH